MVGNFPPIIDSTLREGEQTPGICFSTEHKVKIAHTLIEAGIKELEGGIPVIGREDENLLKDLSKLNARIICWCRSKEEDLLAAYRCQTGAIHISIPLSDRHLKLTGKNWEWVIDQLYNRGSEMKSECDFISLGAMDASRCTNDRLKEFIFHAIEAGFDRVRLADTVGLSTPLDIIKWAEDFAPYLPYLEFHGHNDLGMANANALTALQMGFSRVSATLLGLGERAGNTALEELALSSLIKNIDNSGLCISTLVDLSKWLSVLCKEPIHPAKPLLGERINSHESGIHVAGLLKDPRSFTAYDPQQWGGAEIKFKWGKQSGNNGLSYLLKKEGFNPRKEHLTKLLQEVKCETNHKKTTIGREEILSIYQKIRYKQEVKEL